MTAYLYDCAGNGDGESVTAFDELPDENDDGSAWEFAPQADLFILDACERELFRDDDNGDDVALMWEDGNGFAYSRVFPTREAACTFWAEYNGMKEAIG